VQDLFACDCHRSILPKAGAKRHFRGLRAIGIRSADPDLAQKERAPFKGARSKLDP